MSKSIQKLRCSGYGLFKILGLTLCVMAGIPLTHAASAEESTSTLHYSNSIKPDRLILLDIIRSGQQLFAVGEMGVIMRSEDEGQHWQITRTSNRRTFTGIAFSDDKTGVAVGHGGSIFRSEDAGKTWQPIVFADIGKDTVMGVLSLGNQHMIAWGAFGMYIESQDAGKTWERRKVISEDFDRHISKIVKAQDYLLLVGESGTLARSADQGKTWQKLESGYTGSFFGGLATPKGAWLIYGMRGNIYRSSNHGDTWQHIEIAGKTGLMGGTLLKDGTVALCGNNGLWMLSKDDGLSFKGARTKNGADLAAIIPAQQADKIIAVGLRGVSPMLETASVQFSLNTPAKKN